MTEDHIRNIATDIILTLITCGIFNLYIQHRQIQSVNEMLQEDKYSFVSWFLLTLVSCGLYHIYHEYRKSGDIAQAIGDTSSNEPLINVVLTVIGFSIVADAIQQSQINKYYGKANL